MGLRFLTERSILDRVNRLDPEWKLTGDAGEAALASLEEAGLLLPALRILAPPRFAIYHLALSGLQVTGSLDESEVSLFADLSAILDATFRATDDPSTPSPVATLPEHLAAYVSISPRAASACRANWSVPVDLADDVTQPTPVAFSFYARDQVLRLWILLHACTLRVFVDPVAYSMSDLSSLRLDPRQGVPALHWQAGPDPLLSLLHHLETDRWFESLHTAEAARHWHDVRIHRPEWGDWPDGGTMTFDERVAVQRPILRAHQEACGSTWLASPDGFAQFVRDLWELSELARRSDNGALCDYLTGHLRESIRWMMGLYDFDFSRVCDVVGRCPIDDRTLEEVLRPAWHRSVGWARMHLRCYASVFNTVVGLTSLTKEDTSAFVQYLDDHGLSVWCSELSRLVEECNRPTDLTWERRIQHIVTLASLCEPIVTFLVEDYGSGDDKQLLSKKGNGYRFQAFLKGRAGDYAQLAGEIDAAWGLYTQSTHRPVADCLVDIGTASFPASVAGVARMILRLGAIRNFGSHRFDADPEFVHDHQAELVQSVVLCPMFYWKMAVT